MAKSKKVRKHKQVEIALEPDGFSIHTFELSMKLSKSEWKQIRHILYEEHSNWIYPDGKNGCYICIRYADAGIRIRLEQNDTSEGKTTHFIRMIINPRKLICLQNVYLGILPPEEESIVLLEKTFQHLFRRSPFEHDIRRYYLSRVDLCTNIRCSNKKAFRELVRLLRKTATPKKYERKFYQHRDKKKANQYNKHYIRIACNSQELVIYDKTYQMDENGLAVAYDDLPDSVLRIEVHYSRGKLKSIEGAAGTDDPLDILWLLMQESKTRIVKLVQKCYPDIAYLSYDAAQEQIEHSGFKAATRERILLLLNQMQRKQTIDAAFVQMEKQGFATTDLLGKFEKLGFSPIPLRKGYAAARMPSLTEILCNVDRQAVCIELTYWKWK